MSRTIITSVALSLGALALVGCPEPPPPLPCEGPDDPQLVLSNRREASDLGQQGLVEVFPPPQGGVFAELDVAIRSMALEELEYLRVVVESVPAGEEYANVRYFGDSIPLICAEQGEGQEWLEVANMPVGFTEMYQLDEFDGRPAKVTGIVETAAGEFPVEYDVTLVRTEY